ncbi:flagellar FLiS export co-chaperone [Helicobacter sp. MIT 14-3879]|uniref:flagellar FLiS export co-chaperone n=1 Tax=Helicobacter sp. MIT 14-3879 TaxID=2040649 RepID=UPI0015F169CD|nr:flagellar FLiS export co-chaperone [Helicobacter sp. MIT 14-3879]
MQKNILATLKKHIDSGIIEATPKKVTKIQIHNFGENMKGINEFIGATQILSINLSKIKNLSEKIEWINELLKQEENKNTASMLKTQKNAHLANIKFVIDGAVFMGVKLFDTKLSCIVNKMIFNLNIENPLNYIDNNMFEYCNEKLDEINLIMEKINSRLNDVDKDSNSIGYNESFKENPFIKLL